MKIAIFQNDKEILIAGLDQNGKLKNDRLFSIGSCRHIEDYSRDECNVDDAQIIQIQSKTHYRISMVKKID